MTMIAQKIECPKCHKIFSCNPDVGKMKCPRCGYDELKVFADKVSRF